MANPARNNGLRPQLSAVRPTRRAIGSITTCAATMQADIIAVASFGYAAASFWSLKALVVAWRIAVTNTDAGAQVNRSMALATGMRCAKLLTS